MDDVTAEASADGDEEAAEISAPKLKSRYAACNSSASSSSAAGLVHDLLHGEHADPYQAREQHPIGARIPIKPETANAVFLGQEMRNELAWEEHDAAAAASAAELDPEQLPPPPPQPPASIDDCEVLGEPMMVPGFYNSEGRQQRGGWKECCWHLIDLIQRQDWASVQVFTQQLEARRLRTLEHEAAMKGKGKGKGKSKSKGKGKGKKSWW